MEFNSTINPFTIKEDAGKGKYWLVKISDPFFPDMVYNGTSEGQIRTKLRRNLKKPELAKSAVIERISPSATRKWYRARARDLEGIEESLARRVEKLKVEVSLMERAVNKPVKVELREAASDYHKWRDINKALTRAGKNAKWISTFLTRMGEIEKETRVKSKGSGNNTEHQWDVVNTALSMSGLATRDIMKVIGFLPKGKVVGEVKWYQVIKVLVKYLKWAESKSADFARFFPKYDNSKKFPKVDNSSSSGRNREVRIDDVTFALKKFDKSIPISTFTKIQKELDRIK